MRVLQVESNKEAASVVGGILAAAGLAVDTADADECLGLARAFDFDLVVIGCVPRPIDLILSLRSAAVFSPVMVLSLDNRVETKVAAYGAGADDYAVRPIHKDELCARAKALIRRRVAASAKAGLGNLFVDIDKRLVRVGGVPMPLVGREYSLVERLWQDRGEPVAKWDLMDHVYGDDADRLSEGAKILDVLVCRLRRKFSAAGLKGAELRTVWGRGYLLCEVSP